MEKPSLIMEEEKETEEDRMTRLQAQLMGEGLPKKNKTETKSRLNQSVKKARISD